MWLLCVRPGEIAWAEKGACSPMGRDMTGRRLAFPSGLCVTLGRTCSALKGNSALSLALARSLSFFLSFFPSFMLSFCLSYSVCSPSHCLSFSFTQSVLFLSPTSLPLSLTHSLCVSLFLLPSLFPSLSLSLSLFPHLPLTRPPSPSFSPLSSSPFPILLPDTEPVTAAPAAET